MRTAARIHYQHSSSTTRPSAALNAKRLEQTNSQSQYFLSARPRPTTNRVASIQNNLRKLIGAATNRRGLGRDLVELLKALGHTLPISYPLITNDRPPFSMGMTLTRYDQLNPGYSQDYLLGHWWSLSDISWLLNSILSL
ncbi:hypothetical protein MJO28_011752 [Puccinia striiformis f. sp. tritici]|uniref:Uncharacterized protein n=1 Tax=Puccinia striiformis f. sp. tritici TaxID=168172 RepID=A0ACC0E522_9BASI|nr:hypothetical protein MJO28_011752 [Puccinia striiformis f. sp. tritici]